MKRPKKVCPSQFQVTLEGFVAYLQTKELRESTIFQQSNIITSTLLKLDSYGIAQVGQITPSLIYRLYEDTSDKQNFVYPMRNFLRFLYHSGFLPKDYSHIVPARKKRYPTPSVYSDFEIEKFLETFDLCLPIDIRDYAISMLALRLGIVKKHITQAKSKNPTLFLHSKYSPHCFRHSIAVHMLECGESLVVIKAFLGHESINTTTVYASVTPELANKYLRERGAVFEKINTESSMLASPSVSGLPFLNKLSKK